MFNSNPLIWSSCLLRMLLSRCSVCVCVCVAERERVRVGGGSYLGNPLRGAAGPWQRHWAPGRWRHRGAVWGRTSCYRRSLLHPAQASGSVSPDAAAWRVRGPIPATARRGDTANKWEVCAPPKNKMNPDMYAFHTDDHCCHILLLSWSLSPLALHKSLPLTPPPPKPRLTEKRIYFQINEETRKS